MYIDAFVLAIPTKNMAAYRRVSKAAGRIWRSHGALEYRECVGDDLNLPCGVPFPRLLKLKRGETPIFSWIVYKSLAQRDKINQKVMKDPRIFNIMDPKKMPFDMKRMTMGGFEIFVDM
jgi:uncharacterized protein YbaA (DUF1428 family)